MHFYLKKLKVSNFLSFFGEHEVNLKPFTAIMCNFYEGKDDFFRVLEFVFGAKIGDLRVDNPLDLVHKVLREEMLIGNDIRCFVEITVDLFHENKQLKLYRGVKNGMRSTRIEHKIGGLITSGSLYEEKLCSLGLHIRKKNFIFDKDSFNNIIWGSPEDLELAICNCIRETFLLQEWKKVKKEVDYLAKKKGRAAEKNFNSAKKSHLVIKKFVERFEAASNNRENFLKKILKDFVEVSSSESSLAEADSMEEEEALTKAEQRRENTVKLESQVELLTRRLDDLKQREAYLTSVLYFEEIKLASKPVNASVLQNRISQLKSIVGKKENDLSVIWGKVVEVKSELTKLNQRISDTLLSLGEIQITNYLQNRFTSYGRFCDYLEPSRHMQLLKQIIGDELFYANLCDCMEHAFSALDLMKTLKYEHEEVFISFENYSHKLKDILTASGERGVQIHTLEQLLIFLCKLHHYGLIDEVPVIVQKDIDYDESVADEYVVYIHNGVHFTNDGLIMYKSDGNGFCTNTEKELQGTLIQLQVQQEILYQEWNDLLEMKCRTLIDLNSLENDIMYLKRKWKKTAQTPRGRPESSPLPEIYAEYSETFKECAREWEKSYSEAQGEEEFFGSTPSRSLDISTPSSEDLANLVKLLQGVISEKSAVENEIQVSAKELRLLSTPPHDGIRLQRIFIKLNDLDKTKLFFEKEFKKLKKLIADDDLDDFVGSLEWRNTFISVLSKHFSEIRNDFKKSTELLQDLSTKRKKKLYPFLEHCSQHLTPIFRNLLSDALPFIDLTFNSGEEKLHIMSSLGEERINLVEMSHFNTFLRFISALSIFLEIAVFDKISLIIFDDMEEYFPIQVDNLEAVLNLSTLKKIIPLNQNPRFHLLMRVGQFLEHFIKKHTPRNQVRKNGSNKGHPTGPIQMMYFAKEDLIHSADHYIWIHSQILPDEYISDTCNSYSELQEIQFAN